MDITIYHNPRCSKSRQTLQLLEERGLSPNVVEYLNETPNAATLDTLLQQLNMEPRDFMRKKEEAYQALGLDDTTLSRDELIAAMVENPILIERPVVSTGGQAAIGRPPENVLVLLKS